jgi:hypothetical protein
MCAVDEIISSIIFEDVSTAEVVYSRMKNSRTVDQWKGRDM